MNKRPLVAVCVALAITAVGGLLVGSAAAQKSARYKTYPTCDLLSFDYSGEDPPPHAHSCHLDDYWGTAFIAPHDHNVHYKICIRRPDKSHDCYRRRTHGHGEPDGFSGINQQTGVYHFKWRIRGKGVIDRDRLRVKP